jgi:hypothetical protein
MRVMAATTTRTGPCNTALGAPRFRARIERSLHTRLSQSWTVSYYWIIPRSNGKTLDRIHPVLQKDDNFIIQLLFC